MTCTLCDLSTPDPPVTDDDVAGRFCCRGCLEVYRRLGDVDLDGAREELDAGSGEADAAVEGGEEVYLAVDGMHCTACEAFVESVATGHEGVLAAEASYPSGLAKLTYDPGRIDRDDLPSVVDEAGYRAREVDEPGDGSVSVGRLLVGGFFGMMVMLWYVLFLYPAYLGVDTPFFDVTGPAGGYLIANVWTVTTGVLCYTGFPILRGAYVSLRAGRPNMDLLVALAAVTAYGYSTITALAGGTEVYFDIAVVIVLAVTIGTHYEDRIKRRAAGRLTELTEERVDEARRRAADGTEVVAVDDLTAGDELLVRAGERVPTDGTVVEGTAAVDESLLTGESRPVRKGHGDEAVGGTLVTDGTLTIAVDPGAGSTLDRLVALLWEAQIRPGVGRLADRIAAAFVPLVFVLAIGTVGWHLATGTSATRALLVGLSVLVVSCPCAMGLATPLAVTAGIREALDRGVVVTDGSVFESAPAADVVAFDKTGTLTTGDMRVVDVVGEGLDRAAAVEQFSPHPVADAIVSAADLPYPPVTGFEAHPGRGVSARVEGDEVVVGRRDLFDERGWSVPERFDERAERAHDAGHLPVYVGWAGRARGVVVSGDEPRPGWDSVVDGLAAAGRRVVVITGDTTAAASRFRDHPGVDEVFAEVRPEAKTAVVGRLRAEGTVAMVGDGTNDAPALAAADVGIALGSGTTLAADAADAVIVGDDLTAVPAVFDLAAATEGRIRGNLAWAFGYNAVAIPLAMAGLLNPLLAALAMAASSLLVVGNSARSFDHPDAGGGHGRDRFDTLRPTATP